MNNLKDGLLDWWSDWWPVVIAMVFVLALVIFVGAMCLEQEHRAYTIYVHKTGETNLTYEEFSTLNGQHLLKRIGE